MNLTEANKIREELKAAQEATSEELKAIKIENIKVNILKLNFFFSLTKCKYLNK